MMSIIESLETKLNCFFCNAQLGVSTRNSCNIFKTIIFPIEKRASELIADVLDIEVSEGAVHSDIICRKCFKLVNEFADLEARAAEIRTDLTSNYNNTMRILEEGAAETELKGESSAEDADEAGDDILIETNNEESEETAEEEGPIIFDAEKLSQLVSQAGGTSLSELIFKTQEGGGRPKILVVNDGEYEEIELSEVIGEEDPNSMAGNSLVEIVDEERALEFVGNKHVCRLCPQDENSRPFSCETKNLSLMSVHLKQEHEVRLFLCDLCGAEFKRRGDLNSHMAYHDVTMDSGEHECEVCHRMFSNLRLYRIHRRLHNTQNKAWGCDTCGKKYSSRNLLEEHQNIHTGLRPYSCKTCNKSFASKYTCKAHQKTHESRERNYTCPHCRKTFLSSQNLQQHLKTHSDVKDFVCDICGKGFGSLRNLEVHGIVHTGIKPFVCRHCGKAFARKAEIKDHERTHTGERPFQCEHCGAQFSQRSNLQSHKRVTHYNDRRYNCDQCEKGFKRRRLLDYHVKAVHTGERPYHCTTCDATFVYPEHYKKHIRIHTGVKPYKCEVCDKAFNSRDNRNAHMFVHSDKKPYECLVCGLGFMRKPLLYNHMQIADHMNDTIVVNRPRLEKDSGNSPEQDGDIELTIVDDNNQRQKLYLSELNDHVIIQGNEKALLAQLKDGNIKTVAADEDEDNKPLVDEDGNLVDMDGNVIEIEHIGEEMTMTAHINEQGQLVNEDGQIISEDGQALIVDESMNDDSNSADTITKNGNNGVRMVQIRIPEERVQHWHVKTDEDSSQ